MLRFFKKLCKRKLRKRHERRGRRWNVCSDEACFRKPEYHVRYHKELTWMQRPLEKFLGLPAIDANLMRNVLGYDKLGISGRFCTKHKELLKKDPKCEVNDVRRYDCQAA